VSSMMQSVSDVLHNCHFAPNDRANSSVFNRRLNTAIDDDEVTWGDREFKARAAATVVSTALAESKLEKYWKMEYTQYIHSMRYISRHKTRFSILFK